jgi:multidrug efflux system membrane fusion protein
MVTAARTKTIPIQVRAIGTVRVIATVNVRPQVSGELKAVHFTEGEDVRKGDELFTLDRRPYDAAVKQAQAALAKSKAVLAGARLDLERVERINAGGAAARAELEAAQTALASAEATVTAEEAAVHSAQLQADFTTITAPIDGRTGGLLVTIGNIVTVNDPMPLVVINQISPIYVAFALPETDLQRVVEAQSRQPLKVTAIPRGGGDPVDGELAFVDNAVDPTTGTVQLRGRFANTNRKLWPGQFVDVVLTVAERPQSVVVPTPVVQTGPRGEYVYVVTAQKTAEMRPVTVAFEHEGEAVIATGLTAGETVILEGHLRVAPGARIEIKPPLAGPAGSAGRGAP